MPTYEYICNACGHAFEKFQSMTAEPIKQCPQCGKSKAERKISGGAGFIFKGGGFYETDYRSDGYKKAAEADKAPSSDATSPSSGDAKPAAPKAADGGVTTPAATPKPTESKPAEAPKAATPKGASKAAEK